MLLTILREYIPRSIVSQTSFCINYSAIFILQFSFHVNELYHSYHKGRSLIYRVLLAH